MSHHRWCQVCVALCLVLVLTGCSSRNLPLKVIDSTADAPQTICDDEPGLVVITSPDEIPASRLEMHNYHDLLEQLRALNYGRHFVIAACRGYIGLANPSLIPDIRQIARDGNKVVVRAHFPDAKKILSEEGGNQVETWPYQMAVVKKRGQWGQDIRFVLEVDEEEVQEHTHFVP